MDGTVLNIIIKAQNEAKSALDEAAAQIKKLDKEIADLKGSSGNSGGDAGSAFGKMFKSQLLANLGADLIRNTVSGIFNGIKFGFDSFVDFEDGMAGVTKTAGLTKDEVAALSDEILKIAPTTRSTIPELQTLAQIGGQFGVPKQELAGFTAEINKVNVALGDEFTGGADEVATRLATLKNLFKETQGEDYAQSMKKIGSTINELGADGTATGPVVAEFTNRIGQLGPALAPTITQTLGLGAAFQEFGLSAEISSSGVSNILLTAGKSSEVYAKQLGLTSEAFGQLMKDSPNEMLLRLADSFKSIADDPVALAKKMKELNLDSQESIKVMALLASNTDKVREKQKLAAQAFAEGTSVSKEYDAVNNTTAANLQKTANLIQASFIKLGTSIKTAFDKNETFQKLSAELSKVSEAISKIDFQPIANTISNVLSGALSLIINNFQLLTSVLGGLVAGGTVAAVSSGIAALSTALAAAGGVAGVFGSVMAFAFAPVTLIILGVGLAVAAAIYAFQNWGTITKTTSALWGQFTTFLSQKWGETTSFLSQKSNETTVLLTQKWNETTTFLSQKWNEITTSIKNKANELKTNVDTTIKGIENTIVSFYNTNKPLLDSIFVGLTVYISSKTIPALLKLATTFTINVVQAVASFATTLTTQTIPSLAKMGIAFLTNGVQSVTSFATTLTTQTIPAIVSFGVTLLTQTIPNLIKMGVAFLVNGVQSVTSFAVSITTQAVTALVSFGATILTQTIPNLVRMAAGFLITALPAVLAFAGGLIATVIPALVSTGVAMLAALGPIGIIAIAVAGLYLIWVTNSDKIKALVGIMSNWIGTKMTETENSIKNTMNSAWEFVKNIDVGQIAKDMMDGFVNGIKNGVGNVMSAMKNMANSAVQTAKDNLQIKSPSRVMMEVGVNVGEGMGLGIEKSTANVNEAMVNLSNGISANFNPNLDIKSKFEGSAKQITTGGLLVDQALIAAQKTTNPAVLPTIAGMPQPNQLPQAPQMPKPAEEMNNMAKTPAADKKADVNSIVKPINEATDKAGKSLDELIEKLKTGISKGILEGTDATKEALLAMETGVVELSKMINENFSKIFIGLGGNIPKFIVEGVTSNAQIAFGTVASLSDAVLASVGAEIEGRKKGSEGAANAFSFNSSKPEYFNDFKGSGGGDVNNSNNKTSDNSKFKNSKITINQNQGYEGLLSLANNL